MHGSATNDGGHLNQSVMEDQVELMLWRAVKRRVFNRMGEE
jgi:hypothetical protein